MGCDAFGPEPIWSPDFRIPTACPPGQMEYSRDHLSRRPNWLGTICPWGPNFGGLFVHGTELVCLFVQWDKLIGDQLWGTKCPGPYAFGTKCVTAVKGHLVFFQIFFISKYQFISSFLFLTSLIALNDTQFMTAQFHLSILMFGQKSYFKSLFCKLYNLYYRSVRGWKFMVRQVLSSNIHHGNLAKTAYLSAGATYICMTKL